MASVLRALALGLAMFSFGGAALALTEEDTGTFVALDQQGQPVEKILRVSKRGEAWKFEDRQPDGSWLNVSCHGGCEYRDATLEDLTELFGSDPPPNIRPECVRNEQFAFCHLVRTDGGEKVHGYVLVVRIGEEQWHPVNLARLPNPEDGPENDAAPPPKLEAASLL
ncbi:MAG: hypothetical protein ACT4PZ_02005 [Panacagrimonas sp.]